MPEQDYLGIDDPIDPILPIGQQTSLGVLGEEEEEEDPNKYYYDLFQLESQAPVMPDNTRLQEVYGTAAMLLSNGSGVSCPAGAFMTRMTRMIRCK